VRQFQFIVQSFAILVLLIHSIVPHQHHAELSGAAHQKQHAEASSILDYIALSFHFDHPDGQLEEYTVAQGDIHEVDQFTQIGDLPSAVVDLVFQVETESENHFYTAQVERQNISTSTHSLRGPPSLS